VPLLEKRLTDVKTNALQRSQIVDILAGSSDGGSGAVLLKAWAGETSPEVSDRILLKMKEYLPGKWKDLQKNPVLGDVVNGFLAKDDKRLDALALIAAAERSDFLPKLAELTQNDRLPLEVRVAAVRALGSLKDARATETLITLTSNNETLKPLGDILASLGKQGTPAAKTSSRAWSKTRRRGWSIGKRPSPGWRAARKVRPGCSTSTSKRRLPRTSLPTWLGCCATVRSPTRRSGPSRCCRRRPRWIRRTCPASLPCSLARATSIEASSSWH
jgi:hypothetical protein